MVKSSIRKQLGILRSFAIYYMKPFNGARLSRFYSQFIKKGDLCFDIGAHLGNRTNTWLKLGAKVVAIEPQPSCVSFLEKKFKNNPDFTLVTSAISDAEGKATFRISSLNPTVSTLSYEWQFSEKQPADTLTYWDEELEVPITTLDRLIDQYGMPDFCKIDVEDSELEVLNGLNYKLPSLSFEFFSSKKEKTRKCIERISSLGDYVFNISYKEYLNLEFNSWVSDSELIRILSELNIDISGDIYARIDN